MKAGFDKIGRTVTIETAQRSCLDKKRYPNRNKARDSAARTRRLRPESSPQRPYRCTLCGDFHLTSQVPRGLRGKGNAERGRQQVVAPQYGRLPEEG